MRSQEPTRRGARPAAFADERGFTLPELLVVVLIIGILAAISLTVFLRQQQTGHDGSAKAAARELVTHGRELQRREERLPRLRHVGRARAHGPELWASGPGDVEVTATTTNTYTVRAHSRSGNWFEISRASGGMEHACGPAGVGGCHADSTW